MIKKTIQYIDLYGKNQEETHYFNLTKAEIAKLQVKGDGTFIDNLKKAAENGKVEQLFDFFHDLVRDSYGEKSEDGRRFVKTKEAQEEFESSIAFSELLTNLILDPKELSTFTRGILPPDWAANIQDIQVTGVDAGDQA